MNKKVVTFTVAMVLLLGVTLGATFALLTRTTGEITNTFVAGGIGELTLTEHKVNADGFTIGDDVIEAGNQQYTVIPGTPIQKDPTVTFSADTSDLPVYVFVKLDVENWTSDDGLAFTAQANDKDTLSFSINADVWTLVDGAGDGVTSFVYYKELAKGESLADANIIASNQITVADGVTEEDIAELPTTTLGFKAYAIQSDSFEDELSAWTSVSEQADI